MNIITDYIDCEIEKLQSAKSNLDSKALNNFLTKLSNIVGLVMFIQDPTKPIGCGYIAFTVTNWSNFPLAKRIPKNKIMYNDIGYGCLIIGKNTKGIYTSGISTGQGKIYNLYPRNTLQHNILHFDNPNSQKKLDKLLNEIATLKNIIDDYCKNNNYDPAAVDPYTWTYRTSSYNISDVKSKFQRYLSIKTICKER